MKLGFNRNERVLVGASVALSLTALSALVYWFIAHFRLSIAAHYLTINIARTDWASTTLMVASQITIAGSLVCVLAAATLHRRRRDASEGRVSGVADDKGLPAPKV
jgi:Na+/melibiose symporter-like transporter